MQGLYQIGDFAKIAGVSIDTLRYYHKIGLLIPEHTDRATGYRYYSYPQMVKLDIIKVCRELGLSLEQTAELFQKGDPETFEQSLNAQRAVLHEKIRTLEKAEQTLCRLAERLRAAKETEQKTGFYIREIGVRSIAVSPRAIDFAKDELSNAGAFVELSELLQKNLLAGNYQGGYVYRLCGDKIAAAYLFETVRGTPKRAGLHLWAVPGGSYLCSHYALPERERALERWAAEVKTRGLNPAFLLDSYLIDGTFDSANRRFELQCPLF